MSSVSHAGADTMVTIKVTYQNTARRTKMPLRDMVPRVLEENIRNFLHISPDTKVIIERYSDSAGAFVVLETSNQSIYKQLYRAAKAKNKLKLRVSAPEFPKTTIPKPVTVEDEPESGSQHIEDVAVREPETCQTTTEPAVVSPEPTLVNLLPAEIQLPFRGPPFAKSPNADALKALLNSAPAEQQDDIAASDDQYQEDEAVPRLMGCTHVGPYMKLSQSRPVSCPNLFSVCCNSCQTSVTQAHYHCSTCDDGDFDLCQLCVDQGLTCYDENHWLIKRTMVDGQLVSSSTERIAPKYKAKEEFIKEEIFEDELVEEQPVKEEHLDEVVPSFDYTAEPAHKAWNHLYNTRACNSCVQELPEHEFLHCTTCEDYDLCQLCFMRDAHGHHPKHAFQPAVAGTKIPDHIRVKMTAGRNQVHLAICDGCDKYVTGVRHKCLDCPDWDYCNDCIANAKHSHANHRFVPIYEPLADIQACLAAQPLHMGICCDGPLCSNAQGYPTYIRGVRYKCAVCHDLDFCANCEASPANDHNKTHPLIKFKTPVRHVSVTTTGEHQDGKRMPLMGDRVSTAKATETSSAGATNSINAVQTVVDVKPVELLIDTAEPKSEPVIQQSPEPEIKQEEPVRPSRSLDETELRAEFVRDTVADGTILPANHVFEQTWVLRNTGPVAWPAGCSVKFIGGDYMGHVDSAHPAGISELVSASESTVCYAPLAPGNEFPFTVLLRTPARAGKIISYWRLTTPDGLKYGHRLWCDVQVHMVSKAPTPIEEPKEEETVASGSVMIFPKLDNESPNASMHAETQIESDVHEEKAVESDSLAGCADDDEWDVSDDFMTDEEYDILDASDEEYLEQQQQRK